MDRRTSIASFAVGAALLLGAPATWYALQPADTVGDLEVLGLPEATPAEDPGVADTPITGLDAPPAPPTDDLLDPEAARDAAADTTDAASPATSLEYATTPLSGALPDIARPARISVPRIGVDAPIDPVGREPDGAMEIPHDIRRIGWYEPGGVRPGRNGTAVLSGHVDSRSQGRGAFYDLRRLDVDDEVTITHADGDVSTWRVVARTSYGKAEIPIADIFTRSGAPRLALITCGGAFDASTRSYQENVVVYAVPAGS